MIYVFRNHETGETREVHASMKSPPPERLVFGNMGHSDYREAEHDDLPEVVWSRVYQAVPVRVGNDGATRHKGAEIPISYSMPLDHSGEPCTYNGRPAKKLRCGAYTTPEGYRIVDNKANRDRHMKACGHIDAT